MKIFENAVLSYGSYGTKDEAFQAFRKYHRRRKEASSFGELASTIGFCEYASINAETPTRWRVVWRKTKKSGLMTWQQHVIFNHEAVRPV